MYCTKCGKKLEEYDVKIAYDLMTGDKLESYFGRCPTAQSNFDHSQRVATRTYRTERGTFLPVRVPTK